MKTLIKNGKLVTAADETVADLLIDGETIVLIGVDLDSALADEVIDASGLYVLPGGVDVHTHLDMPWRGVRTIDDFFTGQRAAAFGGTTTHVDFSVQSKGGTLHQAVAEWSANAKDKAVIDYGFHVAITDLTDQVLEEIAELPKIGVTSIKMFMAYKDSLQVDDLTLFKSFQVAKTSGVLSLVHAENGDAIEVLTAQALIAGNTEPIYHALTRPPELEAEATSRAIWLAQVAGDAPLFVVHCTCADALAAVSAARQRGQSVYAETCTQYLFFTKDDLLGTPEDDFNGAKYICSPPLREKSDQIALWRGLATGELSSLSTDHCPWGYAEQKNLGRESFAQIPNGAPGIEDRLYMLWEAGVRSGRMTPSHFVALTATNPAKLFGLYPKKGTLAVGSDADVVLWDGDAEHTVSAATHHSRIDYNLFEGYKVHGKPVKVFVRGKLVVDGEQLLAKPGSGQFVHRHSPLLI
ncbi:MAG: dihydropyrimidinase [Caldilineaceae bacterium]|nr:dihydropyrimidinase [Caldilineaceae bacterium]